MENIRIFLAILNFYIKMEFLLKILLSTGNRKNPNFFRNFDALSKNEMFLGILITQRKNPNYL